MGGTCRVDDFPVVALEHRPLRLGQPPDRIVEDEPRPDRYERAVDMDRVRVAGEVDRVDAVLRKMPPEPVDTLAIGGEAMLHHEVAAEPHHIGGVEEDL